MHSSIKQLKQSSTAVQLPYDPGRQVAVQVIEPPLLKKTPLRLSISLSVAATSTFVRDALLNVANVIAP